MSAYDDGEEEVIEPADISDVPEGFALVDPADPEVDLELDGIQDFILDDEIPVSEEEEGF